MIIEGISKTRTELHSEGGTTEESFKATEESFFL